MTVAGWAVAVCVGSSHGARRAGRHVAPGWGWDNSNKYVMYPLVYMPLYFAYVMAVALRPSGEKTKKCGVVGLWRILLGTSVENDVGGGSLDIGG